MFYSLGNRYKYYDFIYDDSDKSVEYKDLDELKKFGIKISGTLPWIDETFKFNKAKLKYIGFYGYDSVLEFKVCKYRLSSNIIANMLIRIVNEKSICCVFEFWEQDTFRVRVDCKELYKYSYLVNKDESGFSHELKISIPVLMLDYLLNLWSKRDFDCIMQSFDNLFGRNVGKIAKNLHGDKLKVLIWG